jgi:uncharacterized protein (DUF2147 family)
MNKINKTNVMKQLAKIILTVVFSFMFSCSSDDDTNSYKSDIIGTWELTSVIVNGQEFIDSADCLDTITFTETTQLTIEYFDYEDGNGCVVDSDYSPEAYTIDGNKITSSDGNESFTFEITLLNETTLKLKGSYTEGGLTFNFDQTLKKV